MARPRSTLHEVNPATGCWDWKGTCSYNGYGRIKRDDRLQWAHRWYFEQAKGTIPKGWDLDHLCRNIKCVNPDHLEIVSKAENQRRGNACRLSWDKVKYVRANPDGLSMRALGRELGVTHETIRKIIHNKAWIEEIPATYIGGL